MPRFLILRLDAPLMSFGAPIVDNFGVIAAFPAVSMVTGLLGNALGYDRDERAALQRLQDRLILASRIEGAPELAHDFQTARLGGDDRGWTTRGTVEGRTGGAATYDSPHIRHREFWCGATATLAMRLIEDDESPTLDQIAAALREPARPLFIGRKPCLPSRPFLDPEPFVEAPDSRTALDRAAPISRSDSRRNNRRFAFQWPADGSAHGEDSAARRSEAVTDLRLWAAGPHGGERFVFVADTTTEEPAS